MEKHEKSGTVPEKFSRRDTKHLSSDKKGNEKIQVQSREYGRHIWNRKKLTFIWIWGFHSNVYDEVYVPG
jgi:hypothetical protein